MGSNYYFFLLKKCGWTGFGISRNKPRSIIATNIIVKFLQAFTRFNDGYMSDELLELTGVAWHFCMLNKLSAQDLFQLLLTLFILASYVPRRLSNSNDTVDGWGENMHCDLFMWLRTHGYVSRLFLSRCLLKKIWLLFFAWFYLTEISWSFWFYDEFSKKWFKSGSLKKMRTNLFQKAHKLYIRFLKTKEEKKQKVSLHFSATRGSHCRADKPLQTVQKGLNKNNFGLNFKCNSW